MHIVESARTCLIFKVSSGAGRRWPTRCGRWILYFISDAEQRTIINLPAGDEATDEAVKIVSHGQLVATYPRVSSIDCVASQRP